MADALPLARRLGRVVGRALSRPGAAEWRSRARMRRARIAGFFWFLGFVWVGVVIPSAALRLLAVPGRGATIAGGVAGAVIGLWWNGESQRRAAGQPPRTRTGGVLFVGWLAVVAAAIAIAVALD